MLNWLLIIFVLFINKRRRLLEPCCAVVCPIFSLYSRYENRPNASCTCWLLTAVITMFYWCAAPSNKLTKAKLVESDHSDRWNVEFVPREIGELFFVRHPSTFQWNIEPYYRINT